MSDSDLTPGTIIHQGELQGGCHWSLYMRKGTSLRLTDKLGGGNLAMLLYNPENPLEKYNAPDTLKCQHTFKLSKGNCLYSDMGRIFCSIVEDSVGWHETVCGNTTRESIKKKWGEHNYQEYRNQRYQNGNDSFLVELAKYGLGQRDMAANINFFSAVAVDEEGNMQYQAGNSQAGDFVELRFEMNTLVLMHSCPHPLDTAEQYPAHQIGYDIRIAEQAGADDYCMNFRPENQRGFQNNEIYHAGMGCCHD